MKSVGIIAEYNPFHKGHSRQLAFLREQGVENIIVALSGPFVQRGTPAWTDKRLRTRMALEQGVDFLFELPALYALSSAEGFAWGGISLLSAIPLDGVCFGSECGNIKPLQMAADFLTEQDCFPGNGTSGTKQENPSQYQQYLRKYVKQGESYPTAREHALSHLLPELISQYPALLSSANNILAIEYLKAMKKINSSLQPLTLPRNDAGYHSQQIHGEMASASAIRTAFETDSSLERCRQALPETVYSLLQKSLHRYPVKLNDFSELLYLRLRQIKTPEEYTLYGNISIELANRMRKLLPDYTGISSYIDALKTKNTTYSCINRSLTCLLLGITTEQLKQTQYSVPYLRLLGMRREKSSFLRQVTSLPIITKAADYQSILSSFYSQAKDNKSQAEHQKKQSRLSFALNCFETDLLAADIYRQTVYHKLGYLLPDEYRSGIQIV